MFFSGPVGGDCLDVVWLHVESSDVDAFALLPDTGFLGFLPCHVPLETDI